MPATMPSSTPFAIRTILVGTSLAAGSDEVVRNGLRIARACGARVHLAHGFEATLAYATGPAYGVPAYVPELVESTRELARGRLDLQIARFGIHPTELAGVSIVEGPPHTVLAETAAATGADLLVVGAAERWERIAKLLGSTADRVVRLASCPVLVLRGQLAIPPQRVLVAVDLTPISGHALACGLDLMTCLGAVSAARGARVDVLFVVEKQPTLWSVEGERYVPDDRVAREALTDFLGRNCPDPRWRVAPRVRLGVSAAAEILEMSEDLGPDLVVLGTHGRHGLQRALIGSVSERVLRHSYGSVLVVPQAATSDSAADAVEAEGAMVA